MPEVRVVDDDGSQLGIMSTSRARQIAESKGLDLVEIAPTAQPPVCRIMNFGKFKYEQEKKERDSRRSQSLSKVKEVKLHPNVEEHDYQTKLRQTRDFIVSGHRVKVSLFFRGRENAHHELGFEVMRRMLKDLEDVATPEQMPNLMGKLLLMMVAPRRGLKQQQQQAAARPAAETSTPPRPPPRAVPGPSASRG